MTLDDHDLFPEPDDRAPRKCRRHRWAPVAMPDVEKFMADADADSFDNGPGWPMRYIKEATACQSCGKVRDDAATRRNKNNRSRGGREELVIAKALNGRKVGPLGLPHDVVVDGYLRLQVKQLDRWPSLARVLSWLDAMSPADDVRGVTVADTPGLGGRTRRLLIVDLDEYARWHGTRFPGETA
jgi:hypothetical protein